MPFCGLRKFAGAGGVAAASIPDVSEKKRRRLVLAICCTSIFLVGLDTTAVNVALPSIGQELRLGVRELEWVVDAYTLVLAGLLITSGALADRVGRRRVFRIGLVLFAAGSVGCAVAPAWRCWSRRGRCRVSAGRCSARWRWPSWWA